MNQPFNMEHIQHEGAENMQVTSMDSVRIREMDAPLQMEHTLLLPRNGGAWEAEPGNSAWIPDRELEPGDRNGTNPEHQTWGELLDKYDIDKVSFSDGYPDFTEIARGSVQIDDFSSERDSNFDQADEKLAAQRGCTPEEVAQWRHENRYTWHECPDCSTMLKVPREIHGNISHSGGISEFKARHLDPSN